MHNVRLRSSLVHLLLAVPSPPPRGRARAALRTGRRGVRLRPYHARVKEEIERFGGTVEKFIGDAVMAVFGAPDAHEDDPERAVNAALRVVTAIDELNERQPNLALSVRAAINTGEAVVTL